MEILFNIFIVVITFCFMEFMAWFSHKYIMHSFLWILHKDHHHRKHDGPLEFNDFFFLMFATPAILLSYYGYNDGAYDFRFWIGIGISLYGFAYTLAHEIFIHQRIKIFRQTDNIYFRAMRKAHKIHHKHLGKEEGECFGFLWVPKKYLDAERSK